VRRFRATGSTLQLWSVNQVNPALMSSALKRRVQPHTDNFKRGFETDHSFADGNNIGVIVLPSEPGGFHIPAQCTTDAFHPVRRYRFAIAGTAQYNATLKFAARDGFRHGPDEQRIIHRLFRVRAKIRNVVPQALQQFPDLFLVPESGVVRANGNFHELKCAKRWHDRFDFSSLRPLALPFDFDRAMKSGYLGWQTGG